MTLILATCITLGASAVAYVAGVHAAFARMAPVVIEASWRGPGAPSKKDNPFRKVQR